MQQPALAHLLTDDTIDLLCRLGRPGARLRRHGNAAVLENTGSASRREIGATALREADAAGYLATVKSDAVLCVLSADGQAALRAFLMSAAGISRGRGRVPHGRRSDRQALAPSHDSILSASRAPMRRSVIEQLALRKDGDGQPLLGQFELAAGQRFAADFAMAGLQPRVTARWSAEAVSAQRRRSAPDAGASATPTATAAQERVRDALSALGGTLANMVLDVCAFDRRLEAVEEERGWPRRSGRIVLVGALQQLAQHYGLILRPRPQSVNIVHWGDGAHQPGTTAR
jgi:Domain of unknown function (DUF6456)